MGGRQGRDAVRPPAGTPRPLTGREEQVARMAAGGMTSPQIADRLSVSRHTVRAHLFSAYRKTHTGSRPALAAWLAGNAPGGQRA